MNALDYQPIDADAKHGNSQLVKLGDTFAAAWWTGTMWAYRGTVEQLDFEPTHYAVLASGMEAPSGGETVQQGSTEGDSPTAEGGDAHA